MKKVYIETLGCSKNVTDSEIMLGILDDHYELCDDVSDAQILIVNTCSFIHDAKEESIEAILELSRLKQTAACEKLIVTGCLSQRYPEALIEEIPEIDAIIGTSNFYEINDVIELIYKDQSEKMFMKNIDIEIPESLPRILTTPKHYAYLKISEGCDNKCTYCIIPKLRGKYRSRKIEDIVDEAKDLAGMGVKELLIIAQDTSRYGIDIYDMPKLDVLLTELAKIDGIHWIRVHYSYPDILDDRLLEGFFSNDKVINYFDIPVQHASDKILKLMNRRTSLADIESIIDKIRLKDPLSVIRTTVIVGFPGETKEDFNILMKFIKKVKFDRLGAFEYSDEEDTPAMLLKNKISDEVKQERRNTLMSEQMIISESLSYSRIGRIYEVVVEEVAEEGKILVGRTAYDSPDIDGVVYIHTDKSIEFGSFVNVKITDALEYDLIGVLDDEHEYRQ
ncbi:30S ribosomal protein S12 methylthiotransferase RimO [Fusibacter bizertensis]|uniref:Ribosomal protein uS12 methylthiotransferase RimO n=1 Tax=Fusibacter bizertensis TaxID=1488331 RepID=A0ABT6N831_9FIRM|nr:30S ribosomal protein S12 methylthiotransferase RimO [Fusibacter bizertensis]MDH8676575.1 30S ribosomal protein S12 methylthiotransferase RimO [Fusibacter bizertensis]